MTRYDIIGDIHGQDQKLEALLQKMGYMPEGRGYRPPEGRQVIFLGDLIDRGPGQLRVLEIVQAMVDAGHARCIMGNHEFNAIGFITPDASGQDTLRPSRANTKKAHQNRKQHQEFLDQVGEGSTQHHAWVEWFKTLPVCLDLGGFRVVHGCWDEDAVALLHKAGWVPGHKLSDDLVHELHRIEPTGEESALMRARKLLTCGLEIPLPEGKELRKEGMSFDTLRIASWREGAKVLRELAMAPSGNDHILDELEWPADLKLTPVRGSPVFVGHHWFSGHPVIESEKFACLDWSAAKQGPLVAYRWDGEERLSNDKLVW